METSGAEAAAAAHSDGVSEGPDASVIDSSGDNLKGNVEKEASSVLVEEEEAGSQGKEAQQPSASVKRDEASWDPLKKPAK
jgi:hypothetical protein